MEKFVASLANNYVSAKDEGIEAALVAANDTGVGQATPIAGTPGTEPSLNEGTQAAYDRITGKLPKITVPSEAAKIVTEADRRKPEAPNSFAGDLTKQFAKDTFKGVVDGLAASEVSKRYGASPRGAGWWGMAAAAGPVLIDHWKDIANIKSVPAECDGLYCDRMD